MKFTWNLNPVIWQITETYGIRYYGVLFSLLFIGGYLLFRWQVRRGGGTEDDVVYVAWPAALGAVIGARLGHCLFYDAPRLLADPLWFFKVWEGGLASHGALAGLLVALWFYARMHHQSYVECLDRFTFSAALATIMVRIGNFLNSEIVGRVTDQTWGVRFPRYDGVPAALAPLRHPSQLYEAAMGCIVMAILLIADRKLGGEKRPRGAIASLAMMTYFTGRFLVEFVKAHQVLPQSFPLTMGQILSLPLIIIGAVWFRLALRRNVPAHWNVTEPEPEPVPARKKSKKGKNKKKR